MRALRYTQHKPMAVYCEKKKRERKMDTEQDTKKKKKKRESSSSSRRGIFLQMNSSQLVIRLSACVCRLVIQCESKRSPIDRAWSGSRDRAQPNSAQRLNAFAVRLGVWSRSTLAASKKWHFLFGARNLFSIARPLNFPSGAVLYLCIITTSYYRYTLGQNPFAHMSRGVFIGPHHVTRLRQD